jgi:geranyl-CoA carboxylase alpha subunit
MPQPTPFTKVLIANRGEIALRVMRSCHALGYRTVAVYSEVDAQAAHALAADEAVCIGAAAPADSYLNIAAIIAAARRTGADAVHPGYGFLAERADFAQACQDAGLVFIGPSPQAIAAMGDKARAKALMAQAGVRTIPGYQGEDQAPARLAAEAARIGWPVMIKACAGGGGRGMRLVAAAADFADALASAQREAQAAFGDATVLLERAVLRPCHIEVQVFADRHGHAVHLGERDCSVQRRHQKLIEESPSPAVSAALRARMGAVAVQAALAIGYEGAGTLEFLLDAAGDFWFMEMNTRLQVEHAVTEAITGLDLVAWQLQVAAGAPLPLAQGDIRFAGHAIEVRLCAEDPAQGFLPQSGPVHAWVMPEGQPSDGLRTDHALRPGDSVPPHYDSMIAKLVAHGADRPQALRRLARALDGAVALGLPTNQDLLAACLADPVFATGGATTAFIAEQQARLLAAPDDAAVARAGAVAVALGLLAGRDAALGPSAGAPPHGWPRLQRLRVNGTALAGQALWQGTQTVQATLGGLAVVVQRIAHQGGRARLLVDGVACDVAWAGHGTQCWLRLQGRNWLVHDDGLAAAASAGSADGSDGRLRASMSGRVAALPVAVGERVAAGQALLVLEAMKMEHVHAAPHAGTVTALRVAIGDQVAGGRVLVEITADPV